MAKLKAKVQARIPISSRIKFEKITEEEIAGSKEKLTKTQIFIDLIEKEYNEYYGK